MALIAPSRLDCRSANERHDLACKSLQSLTHGMKLQHEARDAKLFVDAYTLCDQFWRPNKTGSERLCRDGRRRVCLNAKRFVLRLRQGRAKRDMRAHADADFATVPHPPRAHGSHIRTHQFEIFLVIFMPRLIGREPEVTLARDDLLPHGDPLAA